MLLSRVFCRVLMFKLVFNQVRACVLYVDPSTRVVGLSLRSYLVQPGARVDPYPVDRTGEVVENCKITTSHHMSGALLELPDQTVTFVHVSVHGMYRHAFGLKSTCGDIRLIICGPNRGTT